MFSGYQANSDTFAAGQAESANSLRVILCNCKPSIAVTRSRGHVARGGQAEFKLNKMPRPVAPRPPPPPSSFAA